MCVLLYWVNLCEAAALYAEELQAPLLNPQPAATAQCQPAACHSVCARVALLLAGCRTQSRPAVLTLHIHLQELPVVVEAGTLLYALNEYLAR